MRVGMAVTVVMVVGVRVIVVGFGFVGVVRLIVFVRVGVMVFVAAFQMNIEFDAGNTGLVPTGDMKVIIGKSELLEFMFEAMRIQA